MSDTPKLTVPALLARQGRVILRDAAAAAIVLFLISLLLPNQYTASTLLLPPTDTSATLLQPGSGLPFSLKEMRLPVPAWVTIALSARLPPATGICGVNPAERPDWLVATICW